MSHYLIFSKRHTQGIAMWWRANAAGYTNNLDEAGRYTKEEAESYCAASHGDDVPVREVGAYSLAQRRIVDMGDGANQALLMMPNVELRGAEQASPAERPT